MNLFSVDYIQNQFFSLNYHLLNHTLHSFCTKTLPSATIAIPIINLERSEANQSVFYL